MLYHLFDLKRDPSTYNTTFGETMLVGYNRGRSFIDLVGSNDISYFGRDSWDGMLSVGLTTTFDDIPKYLPLHKSVELWGDSDGRMQKATRPIILERFFYESHQGLIPYCWKYVDGALGSTALVHCSNLEKVHAELQGLVDVLSIQNPYKVYLDVLKSQRSTVLQERFTELSLHVLFDKTLPMSRHTFTPETITKTLEGMCRDLEWSWERQRPRKTPFRLYDELIAPRYNMNDPISRFAPEGPVSQSKLSRFYTKPPFDVSPPDLIVITHTATVHNHGAVCRLLAARLDKVLLTDYSITITLVNRVAHSCRWDYATFRYLPIFCLESKRLLSQAQTALNEVAALAFACLLNDTTSRETQSLDPGWLDAIDVRIVKTFGEEALVTIIYKDSVVAEYYIDFAALTFCSMGVTSDSKTFKNDAANTWF